MPTPALALSLALAGSLASPRSPAPGELAHELYRAQIAAAESALRLREHAVARTWLDETDPERRGFEWRVHDASLDQSLTSVAFESSGARSIACSPDGKTLACGLLNGALELRSAADGARLATIAAHAEAIAQVRFDASGTRLVSASFDRKVKLWDVERRALLREFTGHGFPVGGAAFGPDGAWIASCSYERPPNAVVGTVHVWDARNGQLLRTLEGGRKPLVALELSPDGTRIAAASWDFCVYVWNAEGGAPIECAMPDEGEYNAVDGLAWSPDGTLVAGASRDRTARVWKADTGELVASLRGHTDFVGAVRFSPDGASLATASADGSARLWSTADWSSRAELRGHAAGLADLCFAPDGALLYSSAHDRSLRSWDARTDWYGGQRARAERALYVVRFRPDDARIASASYDGRVQVWDARTLAPLASWQAHPSQQSCHALDWTADGTRLLSGSWEPVVRLWDAETQQELASFPQPSGTHDLACAPRGSLAASCSGKNVLVYDLDARKQLHALSGHEKTVYALNFSPDGERIVSAGADGRALVWHAARGELLYAIEGSGGELAEAAFTPDGAQLVVAAKNGRVRLHAANDGALVRELARLRHAIDHLALSPDGSRAALASATVSFVDLQRGGLVGELRPHADAPYDLDFDARGLRLVSCSTDGTLALSDTRPLRTLLAEAAAR